MAIAPPLKVLVIPFRLYQPKLVTKMRNDLALADELLSHAESVNPDAGVAIRNGQRELMMTIAMIKAWNARIAGQIHLTLHEKKDALRCLEHAATLDENCEICHLLGTVFADSKRPGEALKMFERAAEHDPDGETGVAARKEAGRIAAKRFSNRYWFVGSKWAVAFLVLFSIWLILGITGVGEFGIGEAVAILLAVSLPALYIWRSLRS